jgi:hypothetical protein
MQEPGQKACCNWRARRPYVRPAYIHEVDRRYISENIERPIWQRPPSVLHETRAVRDQGQQQGNIAVHNTEYVGRIR